MTLGPASTWAQTPTPTPAPQNLLGNLKNFAKDHAQDLIENGFDVKGLTLNGGTVRDRKAGETHSYYNLGYKGDTVSERKQKGVKPSDLQSDTVTFPKGGDAKDLQIRVEKGTAKLDGTLAELLATREINLFREGSYLSRLRGTAITSVDSATDHAEVAFGLETPPLHPLKAISKNPKASNWMTIGLQGGHEDYDPDPDNGVSTDKKSRFVTRVSYRAFFAKGFGYQQSTELRQAKKEFKDLESKDYAAIRKYIVTGKAPWNVADKDKKEVPAQTKHYLDSTLSQLYLQLTSIDPNLDIVDNKPGGVLQKLKDPEGNLQSILSGYVMGAAGRKLNGAVPAESPQAAGEISAYPASQPSTAGASAAAQLLDLVVQSGFYFDGPGKFANAAGVSVGIKEDLLKGEQSELLREITDPALRKGIIDAATSNFPDQGDGVATGVTAVKLASIKKKDLVVANRKILEAILGPTVLTPVGTESEAVRKIKIDQLTAAALKIVDSPRASLWLESTGWKSMPDASFERKFNNLAAATLTGWLDNSREHKRWVRVRYEYGRDRATPGVGKNFVAVTYGLAF